MPVLRPGAKPAFSGNLRYEGCCITRGDELIEWIGQEDFWRLPTYIHRIAPLAFGKTAFLHLRVSARNQVESFQPLLRAQRAVLEVEGFADFEKTGLQSLEELDRIGDSKPVLEQPVIWLVFSHIGGFEGVFAGREACRQGREFLDLSFYDSRFSSIQDKNLQLDMAISRLLYPVELSEKAAASYEALIRKRFRPALFRLVSGDWNRYGQIPQRSSWLLSLKKMDAFLRRDLLNRAAQAGQTGFVPLLLAGEGLPCREEATDRRDSLAGIWARTAGEVAHRFPQLKAVCGLLQPGKYLEPHALEETLRKTLCSRSENLRNSGDWERFYVHMLFHGLYGHPFSEKKNRRGREAFLWHLACDIAVEYMVDTLFEPQDEEALRRRRIYDRLLRGGLSLTAGPVFQELLRTSWQDPALPLSSLMQLFARDVHAGWKTTWEAGNHPVKERDALGKETPLTEKQTWEAAGESLWQRTGHGGSRRSSGRARREEAANLTRRKGHDYQEFLRQFMTCKEDRILDLDSFDPICYTYGLRNYGNVPFVEPLETKEVWRLEELVIVIDTSGSCSGRLVRFFLEETWSVFQEEENFFDAFQVRILQCDVCVQEDVALTSLEQAERYMKHLTIKGGGGTDFQAAFSYIQKLRKKGELPHLKGILYFTDGFGAFPQTSPGCQTAFIFLKSRYGEIEVPYWAQKLLLELPEGADWEPEYTGGFQTPV